MSHATSVTPQEYIEVFKSNSLWPEYNPKTNTMSFYYKTAGKKTAVLSECISFDKIHHYIYNNNNGTKYAWYHANREQDILVAIHKWQNKIHVYDIGSISKFKRELLNVANEIFFNYYDSQCNGKFIDAYEAYEFLVNEQDVFEIQFIKMNNGDL